MSRAGFAKSLEKNKLGPCSKGTFVDASDVSDVKCQECPAGSFPHLCTLHIWIIQITVSGWFATALTMKIVLTSRSISEFG